MNLKNLVSPKTVLALFFLVIALEVAALQVCMRIDDVVHVDLYRYGLQFNTVWAAEYWVSYRIVMACLFGATVMMGFTLIPYYIYSREYTVASRWSCILFPLISASFAVVSFYFIMQIDSVINVTLYQYGLRFSPEWAANYWSITRSILAMVGTAVMVSTIMAPITWAITKD